MIWNSEECDTFTKSAHSPEVYVASSPFTEMEQINRRAARQQIPREGQSKDSQSSYLGCLQNMSSEQKHDVKSMAGVKSFDDRTRLTDWNIWYPTALRRQPLPRLIICRFPGPA